MSQFAFLVAEFHEAYDSAHRAEALANSDPRASCFYARRALELGVAWAYENDATLQLPYQTMSASQIEFVSMIVDYLTEHGVMEPKMLYESPFTDVNPLGPEGLFETAWIDRLFETLQTIRTRATVLTS